ncbi:hypothetical protein [Butyricimonas paravirosa]|jgi:hypothetical protein|uniref:hypothetical protein n=1 Tax=Butyricimonas paravirosa TaxID=1472417 RepID=UPI0022E631DA|nr:hypothetical protein [Butyricimonas paravirosa]
MAIERELWLTLIKEGLVPDTSFLSRSVDMSEFVDANKLNLAEAGVDPEVLIDNDVFPVPSSQREDIPKELLLHTFDTKNTIVRNIEEKESSYSKMESVVRSHRNALIKKTSAFAAHNWCPTKNGEFTPVIASSGAVNASGVKKVGFEDFLQMEAKFRTLDVDMNTLVAVLNPVHLADLMAEDMKLYKEVLSSGKLFSFSLFTYSGLPLFDTATGNKKALGAAKGENDTQASLCYCDTEVCRAAGDMEVFIKYKDPEQRGDVIGYQQRFTALSIRGKYTGAIYSGK